MIEVAVGVLFRNQLYLACQRKRGARFELKWEFPGGKIEAGETAREALIRELREELGIKVKRAELFHTQEWAYKDTSGKTGDDGTFRVVYFRVLEFVGEPTNNAFESIRWVSLVELKKLDLLEGNREAVEILGIAL